MELWMCIVVERVKILVKQFLKQHDIKQNGVQKCLKWPSP